MSKKKNTTKSRTTKKTGEALRKDALAQVEKNIAAIEASERGGKKAARMSKSAARAEGAAKVRAAKAAKPAGAKAKRVSGLDLAAKVLVESKEPLAARTIAERAIAAGWKTSGKTPRATLYAAIIREIAAKGSSARFKKTDRGLFTAHAGAK
ncbi:MAG: winged helix-turn-helix domain-containing protein [Phycisphaerales bacterium]|nr:winged helix-turn-helix domain-containing protein [Phycisphaerales bacterium]